MPLLHDYVTDLTVNVPVANLWHAVNFCKMFSRFTLGRSEVDYEASARRFSA
jgi:hypothetical protein